MVGTKPALAVPGFDSRVLCLDKYHIWPGSCVVVGVGVVSASWFSRLRASFSYRSLPVCVYLSLLFLSQQNMPSYDGVEPLVCVRLSRRPRFTRFRLISSADFEWLS